MTTVRRVHGASNRPREFAHLRMIAGLAVLCTLPAGRSPLRGPERRLGYLSGTVGKGASELVRLFVRLVRTGFSRSLGRMGRTAGFRQRGTDSKAFLCPACSFSCLQPIIPPPGSAMPWILHRCQRTSVAFALGRSVVHVTTATELASLSFGAGWGARVSAGLVLE